MTPAEDQSQSAQAPWLRPDLTSSIPLTFGAWGVQRIPRGVRPPEPEQLSDEGMTAAALRADRDGAIAWVWWPNCDHLVTPYDVLPLAAAVCERDLGLWRKRLPIAAAWSIATVLGLGFLVFLVWFAPEGSVDQGLVLLALLGLAHALDAGPLTVSRCLMAIRRLQRDHVAYRAGQSAIQRLPLWLARRRPRSPMVLAVVLAVLFVLQQNAGSIALERFALMRGPVLEGDWFRLLTAAGLHAGIGHVLLNGLAGMALASLLERLTNWGVVSTTVLVAVVGGSLASILAHPATPSVGASGGILGLGGAILGLALRRRELREAGLASNILRWLVLLGVIGILGWGSIDNAAHAGGFIAGAAVGWWAAPQPGAWPAERSVIASWIGPLALGILLAVAGWMVVSLVG